MNYKVPSNINAWPNSWWNWVLSQRPWKRVGYFTLMDHPMPREPKLT